MKHESRSVGDTRALGAAAAATARPGDVFAMIGGLGAGKTEFVRGFVAACQDSPDVKSPSFSLLNIYETDRFDIYHFDFYRLRNRTELQQIGLREYLDGNGVCLIEWADMFMEELPATGVRVIRFADGGQTVRMIDVQD